MDLREKSLNEKRHPWELSRAYKIISVYEKYDLRKQSAVIADIGAGDRFFCDQLRSSLRKKNMQPTVFAVDSAYDTSETRENEIILLNNLNSLDDCSLDCIVMMDVLEHIQDDGSFLKAALEKLKTNGTLIITVPAYQSLYSSHDVFLKHFRRYSLKDIRRLLSDNHMSVVCAQYFYATLCVARWLQLRLGLCKQANEQKGVGVWQYKESHTVTKVIKWLLNADFSICSILSSVGIFLPGLSILAVSVKNTR